MAEKIEKSEEEWKKVLSRDQYLVLRQKGTEPAFTGKYYNLKEKGTYLCAACKQELFSSDDKYDSGTGWPSFTRPIAEDRVIRQEDNSHFMKRVEVLCSRCGSHLGHVFDDGPAPTGERFCMNSISIDFRKAE
ncbi:MAG: peptide-methionine (R)-S-oxide reductase [Methanolobus sp.]|jgi:peptide-methionine (R)-S-oxide reductase|nr:peptide-methionine (R)-S-oxide reductase [Methanolobus sp.]MDK2833412.1 peptide-methionine (R)-S-oxide reductase [Methanolobus sp.]MDK2911694.1 peptide-methionine (R)-S-oxide reductase [Methanolobus sp.]MDN5308805.1 peptide-methionine (R)-S-oxide reductase [Methanolobus sp.]